MIPYPVTIGTLLIIGLIGIAYAVCDDFKIKNNYTAIGRIILYIYAYTLIQEIITLISSLLK